MVDALTLRGDEGRGTAAISFGEAPSSLRSGDLRMGKPDKVNPYHFIPDRYGERTRGSETSQYPEERRPIGISLVAASETEEAQTEPYFLILSVIICLCVLFTLYRIKYQPNYISGKLTICHEDCDNITAVQSTLLIEETMMVIGSWFTQKYTGTLKMLLKEKQS